MRPVTRSCRATWIRSRRTWPGCGRRSGRPGRAVGDLPEPTLDAQRPPAGGTGTERQRDRPRGREGAENDDRRGDVRPGDGGGRVPGRGVAVSQKTWGGRFEGGTDARVE